MLQSGEIYIIAFLLLFSYFQWLRFKRRRLMDEEIMHNIRELAAVSTLQLLGERIIRYLANRMGFLFGELLIFNPEQGTFSSIYRIKTKKGADVYAQDREISDNIFITSGLLHINIYSPLLIWLEDKNQIIENKKVLNNLYDYQNKEEMRNYFESLEIDLLVPLVLNYSLIGLIHLGGKQKKKKIFSLKGLLFRFLSLKGYKKNFFLDRWRFYASTIFSHALLYNRVIALNEELESRVRARTRELEEATAHLIQSEKMASVGLLVAGVSHEINTPIGVARGSVENILRTNQKIMQNVMDVVRSPWTMRDLMIFFKLLNIVFLHSRQHKLTGKKRFLLEQELEEKIALQLNHRPRTRENFKRQHVNDFDEIIQLIIDFQLEEHLPELLFLASRFPYPLIVSFYENIGNWKDNIDNIDFAVQNVVRIVKALKIYSRTDPGIVQFVPIKDGIENTLIILHNSLKKISNLDIKISEEHRIYCYAEELNQVWTNIIMNAISAIEESIELKILSSDNSTLEIESFEYERHPFFDDGESTYPVYTDLVDNDYRGPWLSVRIRDNGVGMDESVISRIFEPFFTTKSHSEGTGLGLGIVTNIVKKHNGQIFVRSSLHKGSEFNILLAKNWLNNRIS